MQYQLLQQEFWTADTQRVLRTKIEQCNGQTSHYGPAMTTVFRSLTRGKRPERPAGAIVQSVFHTEPEGYSGIMLVFQTITTASAHRNMSQEELRLTHYRQNRGAILNS
ncbi:hypothetical protein BDM02DRAFT_3115233 [Thelephora ganbajun]|uniref:Uncharacterized protein n=1 Tax=Thelephora ganbajun TaxID=370292 RepID=A0ACB6ZGZ2_THEGA|nr:hypothetical protein BDM02DRAFT_3115233 [Thelephora ganbajun]